MRILLIALAVFAVEIAFIALARAEAPVVSQSAVRAAVEKSLPLLMTGAVGHRENRTCFACHNQGPPLFALTAARQRGFSIDDEELGRQQAFIAKFLDGNRENFLQGKGTGGQADTAGYALWALGAAGWKADATTAAVAEYLLHRHKDKEFWQTTSTRPPSEAGSFTTTYIALYGLGYYGTTEQQQRIAARKEQVRSWLSKPPPKDNEDRVFRLLALQAVDGSTDELAAAGKELLAKQRGDGGWAQLDSGEPSGATESDAYATGTALVALHETGGLTASDPVYQK